MNDKAKGELLKAIVDAQTPKPPITRRVWPKEEVRRVNPFDHIIERILIKETGFSSGSQEVADFVQALVKGQGDEWVTKYFNMPTSE